jgi:hypothetical protein
VRFICLSLYAERSRDPAPCRRIAPGDREAQALRDACVSGVAIARGDPELCEEASLAASRDACILLLVLDHGADPANCARLTEPALQSVCRDAD